MRKLGNSEAVCFFNSFRKCRVVNLLVKRRIIATLSVNIMSQHILTVIYTANSWVSVSTAVRMERRFAKVCGESWIGKPPGGVVKLRLTLVHFLLVLQLCWSKFRLLWLNRFTFNWWFTSIMGWMVVWLHILHVILKNLNLLFLFRLTFSFVHSLFKRSLIIQILI